MTLLHKPNLREKADKFLNLLSLLQPLVRGPVLFIRESRVHIKKKKRKKLMAYLRNNLFF